MPRGVRMPTFWKVMTFLAWAAIGAALAITITR